MTMCLGGPPLYWLIYIGTLLFKIYYGCKYSLVFYIVRCWKERDRRNSITYLGPEPTVCNIIKELNCDTCQCSMHVMVANALSSAVFCSGIKSDTRNNNFLHSRSWCTDMGKYKYIQIKHEYLLLTRNNFSQRLRRKILRTLFLPNLFYLTIKVSYFLFSMSSMLFYIYLIVLLTAWCELVENSTKIAIV